MGHILAFHSIFVLNICDQLFDPLIVPYIKNRNSLWKPRLLQACPT